MSNGAQALIKTLLNNNIEVCFSNPGTSEMHFVAALDENPQMRAVLTLFEGVATGAADGYARMLNKPACTLLHLGCGLGNGLANLHNAHKAKVPVLNIVGDHATYHVKYNAQLQSDIETIARNFSGWVKTTKTPEELCDDAQDAIKSSHKREVATLILPADVSWTDGVEAKEPTQDQFNPEIDETKIQQLVQVLKSSDKVAMILGGAALQEPMLNLLSKISEVTGVQLFAEVFPTKMQRGVGRPYIERMAYFSELASVQLTNFEHIILVDSRRPVSFFAYPDKSSDLVPEGCEVHQLVDDYRNLSFALEHLCEQLNAMHIAPNLQEKSTQLLPYGKLTAKKVCQIIGGLLPENAIISDEAQTSGVMLPKYTRASPKHDLLTLTGGAIGQALPVAIGAAIACPDRTVFALTGDGSAMYTFQSLWTMAREELKVITIVFNNASYSILNIELERVGVKKVGNVAKSQLSLEKPALNFTDMARGMGVSAVRVNSCGGLKKAIRKALALNGPTVIEVMIPSSISGLKLKALPVVLNSLNKMPLKFSKIIKKQIAP
ncbi:MAG: acetolactate synthase large subunit [Acinetobacter sp.]